MPPIESSRFACPACGHHDFEPVSVQRADGSIYRTEFIACAACHSMSWRPELAKQPRAPDFKRLWGSKA